VVQCATAVSRSCNCSDEKAEDVLERRFYEVDFMNGIGIHTALGPQGFCWSNLPDSLLSAWNCVQKFGARGFVVAYCKVAVLVLP
jgi:hypothetical protein